MDVTPSLLAYLDLAANSDFHSLVDLIGVTVGERRKRERLFLDGFFNLIYQGEACRLVDVSMGGLGVTFISDETWPENITFMYSLPQEPGRKRLLPCRTVWETNSDFHNSRITKILRRRGLEFIDPRSEDVEEFCRHLNSMIDETSGAVGGLGSDREL